MVGVNVGIPVPVSFFPFSGHKHSFFGDMHVLGMDGVDFYTETKCVTSRWFTEADRAATKVSHVGGHGQPQLRHRLASFALRGQSSGKGGR